MSETEEKKPVCLFRDAYIAVCRKPAGVLCSEGPGGMTEFLKKATNKKDVYTVHRLDREVGGLCVYALTQRAAAELSAQITDGGFEKDYFCTVHGCPADPEGRLEDLLYHDMRANKTYVVDRMRKGVREAALEYRVLRTAEDRALLRVHLLTGRTHQIRVQFSSRRMPLFGDRRYGSGDDGCGIALLSCRLGFRHPKTGERLEFTLPVPEGQPWDAFAEAEAGT